MFSVIIPLYNKELYIEKAINSVLGQTFTDFELIIVNDGSTDKSSHIIDNIQDKRVQIINQPNQGVSTARNNGVKLSKYDYIAFLDADDWWEVNYLEEMKNLIEEFPEAGIYGSSYYSVKDGNNIPANIGVKNSFKKGLINYCKVYSKTLWMPLTSISTIIKKNIFESENGFKPNLKLGEDFDLWVRIALKYQVAFLNRPLAYYNQDVSDSSKAVILNKIYPPNNHFIFNMDFLNEQENKNSDLKKLLDLLRVYALTRYRLKKVYINEVGIEINKVNFRNLHITAFLKFHLPVWIVKFYYELRISVRKML